jgi:eukaryotic-like serine/threonine-protein kinase
MIGKVVSHYRILEKLGEGGMGVVYKAEDVKLTRTVALKFLPHGLDAHESERARFLQEARAAAILNHPNICTVYDIQEHDDQPFIVMEYVEGKTLREIVPVTKMQDAITYAIQIAEALQEAHKQGIVHRDIKAENIMVNAKNQVKVMDFGLAKLKGSLKLTRTSSTIGTLAYMAPEQIQGEEVDARSDIFSFGIVLYEMLTGHLAFRGEHEAAMIYSILNEDPEPLTKYLPEVPSDLLHLLNRALEKDPADRYQSIGDIAIDLKRIKRDTSKVFRPVPWTAKKSRFLSKRALIAGVVGLLVVLIAGTVYRIVFHAPPRGSLRTLAVLPFRDLASNTADEAWGVPITDVIISRLTSLKNLTVRPTSAVLKYGKAPSDPKQVGRELEVESVLDGTYQRVGAVIRVSVQLVDCETQSSRWARTYDLGTDDQLKFQDEVAQKVVEGLSVRITDAERKDLTTPMTNSREAYDLFLEARSCSFAKSGSSQAESARKVQRLLLEAVAKDPNFSEAYARLSVSYASLYFHEGPGDSMTPRDRLERAQEAAERALQLDPRSADAYSAFGVICWVQGRFEESIPNIRKAISLAPNFSDEWYLLGHQYHFCGLLDQAERAFRRAVELNPTVDLNVCHHVQLLLYLGRTVEAEQEVRRALAANPESILKMSYLGELLYYQGKVQEAQPLLTQAAERWWPAGAPNPLFYESMEFAGYLYASQGKRENIDVRFFKLSPEKIYDGNDAYRRAGVYALLGDRDPAIAWLRRAVELGYNNYPWYARDKNLDKLRANPEFQRILAEVKSNWNRYRDLFAADNTQ